VGGRLTATAAVLRLTYEGTLSFIRDPQTGLFDTVQDGVQRSTGVEFDVMSRPGPGLHHRERDLRHDEAAPQLLLPAS
jgi:hypothetical protein